MSRVGNTVNLEGTSRYDLLIYDFPEGYPSGLVALGFGKTPKRISGVEKCSQVFMKTLLTYSGTDVVNSLRGTQFPSFAGTRNLQSNNLSDIDYDIVDAVKGAEAQAKSILNVNSEGLTSQLESVKIVKIDHIEDTTAVTVQLLTKAGESAQIALPFTSLGLKVD